MMPKKSVKEYNKVREAYTNYLGAYRFLNNGSAEGASTFAQFYIYKTYTIKYLDINRLATGPYK